MYNLADTPFSYMHLMLLSGQMVISSLKCKNATLVPISSHKINLEVIMIKTTGHGPQSNH